MKIVIFGASGSAGKVVLERALSDGHAVTAFMRNPEKFNSLNHPKLKVYQGDVLQKEDVCLSIRNQDAVLSLLGDGAKGKIRAAGTKIILEAMEQEGIGRLITLSTLGAGDSYQNLNFLWKYLMFGLLLRNAFKDHQLQEHYVFNSNIPFTILRPSALTDGPATGNYRVGFGKNEKDLSLKISRADLAEFVLTELKTQRYLNRAVSLSH